MQILKVMLIDDEYMALDYLSELIPWKKYGYEIVAQVTDSGSVVQTFRKEKPQIIISDIRMPGMDGLDLCNQIRAIEPNTKIIFLTAYSDFEYAKKAIGMGVSGYILKHELDEGRLLNELGKIRENIKKENDTNKIINKYVIMNTIGESYSENNIESQQWESLESSGGIFALLLLKEDKPYDFHSETDDEEQKDSDISQIQNYFITDDENGYTYIDFFMLRNGIAALLFSSSKYMSSNDFKNTFYPIANRNRKIIAEKTGKSYSAIFTMGAQKIDSISTMYHSSLRIFSQIPFIGPGKTIFGKDVIIPAENKETVRAADNIIGGIRTSLAELNIIKAIHETACLFDDIILKSLSLPLLEHCSTNLVILLKEWRKKCFLPDFKEKNQSKCYTVEQIRDSFISLMRKSVSGLDPNVNIYSKKVYDAVEFLHKNYSKDISVAMVADALAISESNLSKSFKKETGKSVLDYLTDVRITASKNLLCNTNFKIYQISDMVGYKTSQYFSQVFMKATGVHPGQFRETVENSATRTIN